VDPAGGRPARLGSGMRLEFEFISRYAQSADRDRAGFSASACIGRLLAVR
jgi:hypothetical protein